MSRVVVTGASGRLGRSVVAGLLERGDEVVSVDKTPDSDHVVDLTDANQTTAFFETVRPDAVVHLAAIAVPFSAPEEQIFSTNTSMAFRVLEAAAASGVGKVIAASSPTVLGYGNPLGWTPDALPLDERATTRPWHAYALSKLVIEQTVRSFAESHGDRMRLASFRPCYVIAPEEWSGAPTQQGHSVLERLDDPALAAPALFNYVDARDAASFVGTLLEALPEIPNGETFFVAADDSLARRPTAELLREFAPTIPAHLAEGLVGNQSVFSSAKALGMLGWRPERHWRTELIGAVA